MTRHPKRAFNTGIRWVLAGSLLFMLSCTGTGEPTGPEQLEQGMTVLEAGDGHLSLAYRDGDQVIYLEALRGEPGKYPGEPAMPAWEVDARFTTADGRAFYRRRGGDRWVNAEWGAEREPRATSDQRRQPSRHLFAMATEAARIMRAEIRRQIGEERATALAPEIGAVHQFASQALQIYDRNRTLRLDFIRSNPPIDAPERPADMQPGEVTYGTSGDEDSDQSFDYDYYYIGLHAKCIYLCGGDHSATRINQWQGEWVAVHDFCNHGECAGGMDRKDLLQYYETLASDDKMSWTAQTCDTKYDWDSTDGGHNCHDDSRVQMNNFVYQSTIGGAQYWCDDGGTTTKWKRPSANGDDDEGYNHPYYCDYDWGSENTDCDEGWKGTGDGCDCGCRWDDGTFADPDCNP